VAQHEDRRQHHGRGIGDAFAGDIRRAAVHGLKNRAVLTEICPRHQPQSPDQPRAEV
jgi:hypothetical protein